MDRGWRIEASSDFSSHPIGEGSHKLQNPIAVRLFDERLVNRHRIVARGRPERPSVNDHLPDDLIGRCVCWALAATAWPEDHGVDPNGHRSPGAADAC